ncbi:CMRF35-like molecule 8 [Labeo rohita]|uniref:CMRF35-like molecule 8 n=1 Tax=Labeo rohita TaxID=84645 RepID=A0ABQ8N339_LABRO|nr:CMRF35-like molecule 8 [Labeo rohita]
MENSLAVNITGSVGSNISVTCSYPETYQNNSKFFCQMSSSFALGDVCVHITQQETRSEQGRLVLLDDTSAHVLTANISRLAPEDSGKYWCGVDIAQLPDFTLEIWITVTKEHPPEQTTDLFPKEPGVIVGFASTESYSRFMMMVAFICVGALFFVCLFGLFQVLKRNSCSNSGLVLHYSKAISNPVVDDHQRINLPDLPKVQNEKEELYKTTNPDHTNTKPVDRDSYYIDVVSAQTKDEIYTDLDSNRQTCLRDTSCAKIGYEGKYITFKAVYPPDYETNTKYFGRTHDFFSFEKLVETSHPNRWAKQGAFHFIRQHVSALPYRQNLEIGRRGFWQLLIGTSTRANHRPVPKRAWRQVIVGFASTESYSRFMMMVAFICVGALFFVCLFGLFQVLKRNSCSNSGLVLHYSKAISNPVVDDHQRINLPDLPKVQNEKEELYRTTNPDHTNTKPDNRVLYNIDVVSAQTKDEIHTDLDSNRQSHVYQSLTADSLHQSIYHTTDQKTD